MSYPLFPALQGITWDRVRRPIFSTNVETTAAGAEFRSSAQQYAIYEFDLVVEYLAQADFNSLLGLYLASQGAFTPFYFDAANDDTILAASPQAFAVGDGTATVFQLLKPVGTYLEPLTGTSNNWGIAAPHNILYDNGTPIPTANYSASDGGAGGVITFGAAPTAGHVLSFSGLYYYLCRFKDDQLDFNQFMSAMYEAKAITLRTVR